MKLKTLLAQRKTPRWIRKW